MRIGGIFSHFLINDLFVYSGLQSRQKLHQNHFGPTKTVLVTQKDKALVALMTIENEKKSRLYALIWDYSFINFQQKVPPIRLFSPIFLLIFKEFSHLYFYSDPSSIRNSRVGGQTILLFVHVQGKKCPREGTLEFRIDDGSE